MNIKSADKNFSINPLLTYKEDVIPSVFSDVDKDYSDYGKMIINIRNNGKSDIRLSEIRFYLNSALWYTPALDGTNDTNAVIPADGKWHTLAFDLNKLYLYSNECGISSPNERIENVRNIEFGFESDGSSDLSIDAIRFTPSDENTGLGFGSEIKNADNPLEFLSALFVGFIGMIVSVFE